MFCCTLLHVHSSFAIILMGKIGLVTLLSVSSWCFVMVMWLFLAVPWVCLWSVSVVFPDNTHLLFFGARVCYRLMAVVVKAMHTISTHNILLDSLSSDVKMCMKGSGL